jgi:hypothetical protein
LAPTGNEFRSENIIELDLSQTDNISMDEQITKDFGLFDGWFIARY